MSSRILIALACSTALIAPMSPRASAEDVFMVPLPNRSIETIAAPGASDATNSTGIIAADPSLKKPQTIGTEPTASTEPHLAKASAAPAEAPAEKSAAADSPAVAHAEPLKPEQSNTSAVSEAAPVLSSTPAATSPQGAETAPVVAAGTVEPKHVIATPEPVEAKPITSASVNSLPAATITANPVMPPPAPVVPALATPAPAATADVPTTAPVASPASTGVLAPAVVSAPVGVAAESLAAALKTEIDARFTGKALEDRKMSAEDKKKGAAIAAFYSARNYVALWVDGKGQTETASQLMDRLTHAAEDGLNPADYPLPVLASAPAADMLAKAELQLTEDALKYARHAQAGRFDPIRLGELVTAKPPVPDPDAVLKTVSSAKDISVALAAYNPPHEGYKRLKAKLAELEGGKPPVPVARVPTGPTIRPGEKDTRVALLRDRLGVTGTPTASDASLYDAPLVEAVKSFQKTRGLKPSGIIGQQTVDAVNDASPGADTKAADIIANMERWRWLPRDLGSMHVMVNIPDYAITVERDGVVTHKARAIVGRVQNQTPIFSDTMTHIIVNPYWNVPYSIVKKEYLAKAQETKGAALTRGNFEVEVGNKTVDPATVDWATVNASQVHLRQRPGEGNALGNIKFMFPNQHSVYIHDTSSRGLFVQSYRSLSHGCVRVQDPFSFADALMAEEPTGITGAKLKSMIGGGEKYLWLKRTIPVHIAYFTDFVDDAGALQTRPDLYGHNAKVKQLLGL